MAYMPESQTTSISTHTNDDIFVRDKNLCTDLIGKLSYTQMAFFQILGRLPSDAETIMVDACLVTIMEHGMTPSAISTRITYSSAPEAMQGAVAAGLMSVGSLFVGTSEGCARLLTRLLENENNMEAEAQKIVDEHKAAKKSIPGFGHHLHKPDDPRTITLFKLAENKGMTGKNIKAIQLLNQVIDKNFGKHITINATGAIAAILSDCGVPTEIMRGFAIISRCAGLVGHIHEEQTKPTLRAIWENAEHIVEYDGEAGK
jgi:citrate synthase